MIKNIAIFASGSGSNAENIINYFQENELINIALILCNRKDAYVFQRAVRLGVEARYFSRSDFEQADKIVAILKEFKIDFIVLAGFLLCVSPVIIKEYPDKIVNIHPALLPRYGGKGMYGDKVHQAVIAAGEKESGITIHYVNERYDEGAIIFQARCPIEAGDGFEEVARKVHALEYEHFPRIIQSVITS